MDKRNFRENWKENHGVHLGPLGGKNKADGSNNTPKKDIRFPGGEVEEKEKRLQIPLWSADVFVGI